ncbi:MAG: sigma-70 family RNA polymerase sigma factor [Deltaproteobacteria bacterium]|nr:sigma-70 family RNA polymerase sigma factor [Deltaproteobacteria bacterium]
MQVISLPSPCTPTSSALLENLVMRAINGDRDAQQSLLIRYRYFIRRTIRSRLGSKLKLREDTSDIEQNVALKILGSLGDFQWQSKSAFISWLRRLVSDAIIDISRFQNAQRRNANYEVLIDEDLVKFPNCSPETWLDENRRLKQLEYVLDQLSDQQAQCLILHYQGHTHAEIGEVFNISAEAARKQVARSRAKLVTLLRHR